MSPILASGHQTTRVDPYGDPSLVERDRLFRLQDEVGKLPPADCPLEHFFARGVYGRGMHIPRGVVVVGKIHKHSCITVMLKGDLSVTSGGVITRLRAGMIAVSPAGTKRAGFAHEDSFVVTVHGVDRSRQFSEADLAELEDELIAKSFEEFEAFRLEGPT